jgi:hypothetical protein
MNHVPEVLEHMAAAIRAEVDGSRKFTGLITILVDADGKWAATCSGMELPAIQQVLQFVRDDAVLGGEGFTVFQESVPEPSKIVMPGSAANN